MKPALAMPAAAMAVIALVAIVVPFLGLPDPVAQDVANRLAGPSSLHLLGQDEYGRDVLSRLLWGARISLGVAVTSAALACVVGVTLGLLGGLFGGVVELLSVRSMDVILCFPQIVLSLLIVTLLGAGVSTLVPLLSLLYLPGFVRVTHAGVIAVRNLEFVEAMHALGAGPIRIMTRTIVPNVGGPILVQFSLATASAVIFESGLSFLGFGVPPPAPSWGVMISDARAVMGQAPQLLLWPCIALSGTILAMNTLCDALRDLVDPSHLAGKRRGWRSLEALLPGLVQPKESALHVKDLTVDVLTPSGNFSPVRDVSFDVRPGRTFAIVGESGSGKTLTALSIMGLLPPAARAAGGAVCFDGKELLRAGEPTVRALRGGPMAMIFQDPLSSMNPVHRVGRQVQEAIMAHRTVSASRAYEESIDLFRQVGIPDPVSRANAYPHELSGGMRQRAMIAMAIANSPRLLIADEPTTALDVTVQAQVLDILATLKRERGMSMVFITHSLPVVAEIADDVAVMYAGEIVEQGTVGAIFAAPLHPYTRALLASAPSEQGELPEGIPGIVPAIDRLPPGCAFAPRCRYAKAQCEAGPPSLVEARPGWATRCVRWQELAEHTGPLQ